MKIFLSYYSDEEANAEDIANHLQTTFRDHDLEVFRASSWDSLAPGDVWESKLITAVEQADALVVLMSFDALGRPWINFEIGVAWAKKTRILLFCHKGMNPTALPRPYGSLQAVDLNGLTQAKMLQQVSNAVATVLNIKIREKREVEEAPSAVGSESFSSKSRAWSLRPGAHIGETASARFLVGPVYPARPERAKAASLAPGEALFARLFLGTTPEGRYVNAMVAGEVADFFEKVVRDTVFIKAKIRLAGAFEEGENTVPLLVVDEFLVVPSPEGAA